jgi:hypothetical protein
MLAGSFCLIDNPNGYAATREAEGQHETGRAGTRDEDSRPGLRTRHVGPS